MASAASIITALRNHRIILADNGQSAGLIGIPDARWNHDDLSCLIVSNDSGATQ